MAKILFVHNNFPGRFEFLLPSLQAAGHQCIAIAQGGRQVDGIPLLQWKSNRSSTQVILELSTRAEADLIRGRAAAHCALHDSSGSRPPAFSFTERRTKAGWSPSRRAPAESSGPSSR